MNVDLRVLMEGGWGNGETGLCLLVVLKDSRKERIHMYGRKLLS